MFQTIVGVSLALSLAAMITAAPHAWAQPQYELKLAYFVGDQHAMSQWLIRWAEKLEKASSGRIAIKRFPASQMGSVQQHYDFARTGQADIVWLLHGGTPGRFPLTEVVQLPYLVGSAEIGTKVLRIKAVSAVEDRGRTTGSWFRVGPRAGPAVKPRNFRIRQHAGHLFEDGR